MSHWDEPLVIVEEYIVAYRSGHVEVLQDILDSFRWLIIKESYSILEKSSYSGLEIHDLYDVGMVALVAAVENFEFGKSVFAGYAKLIIERSMRNYIRECSTNNLNLLNASLSLDEQIYGDSNFTLADSCGEEDPYISRKHIPEEDVGNFIAYIDIEFTEDEKTLLKYRLQGYKYDEIIKITKWSRKKTFNLVKRLKKLLEEYKS